MKMFTKLALVSSVAISANAMAMQSMDDAALSAATGQDGINIGIGISRVEIDKVLIHDNDGLRADGGLPADPTTTPPTAVTVGSKGGTGTAGAIVLGNATTKGVVITTNTASLLASHNLADIVIDTDAGTGTNGAFLNIAAEVSGLNIDIGPIGVSASNAAGSTVRRGNDASNYNEILSGLSLKTGKMDANIQLGAAPQGAMIVLSTTMQGGLEITNLGINDASTNGATIGYTNATPPVAITTTANGVIQLDSIRVSDRAGADLTINAKVAVYGEDTAGGKGYLQIATGSGAAYSATSVAATDSQDVYIKGVHLGSATAASIGDVEIQGLATYYGATGSQKAGALIKISGH
ncbi:pilus assembly protein FilA [Acinetobacter sp. VNH17]|uniref:Pilus assembly protein FilA n=1 Tax=Acinetobacter thutiue TaxID=2998078 RepID=A0ABT7WM73_9GAMM|nr:DUF6160 family protein [Acinetobacter thutiue]MCY6411679.1 pilus assembly protein FilA [Acinetobacter thutiue]MDN0013781.1 pilus assembly protein FilA [Acinetobacter thutiue]